jgi:hypothetical protein
VVDLQERALRVFRDPSASGYRTVSGKQTVKPAALPEAAIEVSALFPA